MKQFARILTTVLILAILIGGTGGSPLADEKPVPHKAIVTIPPQAFLVEEIAGDRFEVSSLVPEDGTPHSASITPEKLRSVRETDVYFRVGTPISFEVNNLSVFKEENQDLSVVKTSQGVELKALDEHYGAESKGNETQNRAVDNHIWLSPSNLKQMAENVYEGIVEIDPVAKDYYKENKNKLIDSISAAQEKLSELLGEYEGRSFVVYHPAWGYFGDEFKLRQVAIQEGKDEPGPRRIREIANFAEEQGINRIITSSQFNPSTSKMVAKEFGGKVSMVNSMEKEILGELIRLGKEISVGYDKS
ncbi:zinc ABC transporter substrate-binding protein [Candidatus Bipolaricaulota bacterium]|nr:zinc ABC transporter substrate-binding protein [Candidatus Bipolaricaulota bacterium]